MLNCCLDLETIIEATTLSHIWVIKREFFVLKPAPAIIKRRPTSVHVSTKHGESRAVDINLGHNRNARPNRLQPFVSDLRAFPMQYQACPTYKARYP